MGSDGRPEPELPELAGKRSFRAKRLGPYFNVTTRPHVLACSIIATGISMLNGSILGYLGWASTLHGIYGTRYYHVQ
jgi:hypothetical protein